MDEDEPAQDSMLVDHLDLSGLPDFKYGTPTPETNGGSRGVLVFARDHPDFLRALGRGIAPFITGESNPFLGLFPDNFKTYVDGQSDLKGSLEALEDGRDDDAEATLSKIIAFFIEPLPPSVEVQRVPTSEKEVVMEAWKCKFEGSADETLFRVIKNSLAWTHELRDQAGAPYVNLIPIVNSSGTGKSRIVDQLGRKHCFVIPLCLRNRNSKGYPPPDDQVRDWLVKPRSTEQGLNIAVAAFLRALFKTAQDRITTIRFQTDKVHTRFAEAMNETGNFLFPQLYRSDFYDEVVKEATKIEDTSNRPVELDDDQKIKDAAQSLLDHCGGHIVVLSFDEAHVLAEKPIAPSGSLSSNEGSLGVTMFSQICKGLHSVQRRNIMGLYLSTSGKHRLIPPQPRHGPSSRLLGGTRVMFPPFTELGFNQLAQELKKPLTLEDVTTAEYVCHLGCPLFGVRWDQGNEDTRALSLGFAQGKLVPPGTNSDIAVLACVAMRFAIEFRPRNEKQEGIEHILVENHMRYCVAANPSLQMSTSSVSEPLLAEAAFNFLHYDKKGQFLEVLARNVDVWGIDQGERGEFVMSLIWMAARDGAVLKRFTTRRGRKPWNPYIHSVVSIMDFMEQLVPNDRHKQLRRMTLSVDTGHGVTFPAAFDGCNLWCNHFIQVQDYNVINTKFLCALLSNGIGVICHPNQAGIDLLWIGLKGDEICEQNLMLILGQAKNNKRFGEKVHDDILDRMDPIELGICAGSSEEPRVIPIIHIVFAMASRAHGVTLVEPCSDLEKLPRFTSYDFWFAGVGPSTFGCVKADEVEYYQDLLASSRPVYNPPLPVSKHFLAYHKDLKEETERLADDRVDLRRTANSMKMALQPHFPRTWHHLFENENEEHGEEEEKGKEQERETGKRKVMQTETEKGKGKKKRKEKERRNGKG